MRNKKIQQSKRLRNKVRTKLLFICLTFSMVVTISGVLLMLLNINNLSKTKASGTGSDGGGNDLGNGLIISEFKWDTNPVTLATVGSDAISVSKDAHSMPGGKSSTDGLSPGVKGKNIDLEIKGDKILIKMV